MRPLERTTRFGVSFPSDLLVRFDSAISSMGYRNRSEALRDTIREMLLARDLTEMGGDSYAIGTITISYTHSAGDLTERLLHLQHDHSDIIVSTTHIHVDHDRCLEVLVAKGRYTDVRALSDRLRSTKGIDQVRLVVVEAGEPGRVTHRH